MLLDEGNRLVLAHGISRAAFECYMRVKLRNPDWPGLDDHVNELLYAEGSAALIAGDSDRGLRLLRELLARKRDYPGPARSARHGLSRLDHPRDRAGPVRQGEAHSSTTWKRWRRNIAVVRDMRDRFIALATKRRQGGPSSGDELAAPGLARRRPADLAHARARPNVCTSRPSRPCPRSTWP